MLEMNFNGYENIFTDRYTYKIELIGITHRVALPKEKKKYSAKETIHIYFKSHGKIFDLSQIIEYGADNRIRVNLGTGNIKIPKEKTSTQFDITSKYFLAENNEILFNFFKSPVIEKAFCDYFEIFLKDIANPGIVLNAENLISVSFEDFETKTKAKLKASL